MLEALKKSKHLFIVTFITFFLAFGYIRIYTVTELGGDFNKHILPANMFGVPNALQEKGLGTLYKLPKQCGWDGQFYYYISNDLLGRTDVPKHCDADAYRYQRIGLPLLANIAAKVMFQDYTSPTVYYLVSLLLVLAATFFFAKFLSDRGYSPYWSLVWSLGLGTQLTLLNGLPDAAADSLVILALLAYLSNRYKIFSILILFAALSREAFIIFPAMFLLQQMIIAYKERNFHIVSFLKNTLPMIIPLIVFALWRFYLHFHFKLSPSEQANGILGYPFVSFFKYLKLSLQSEHPLVPDGWSELGFLLYFFTLLLCTIIASWFMIQKIIYAKNIADPMLPLCGGFSVLVLLYLSFGDTVMMHYTGYMKASTIFFFVIILYFVVLNKKIPLVMTLFFLLGLIVFNKAILHRIHPFNIVNHTFETQPVNLSQYPTSVACLKDFDYNVKIIAEKEMRDDNLMNEMVRKMIRYKTQKLITIELFNTSTVKWPISKGKGTINMSYQWLDHNNRVVRDGIRTSLPHEINAGEHVVIDMIVAYPTKSENLILKFSPVQEGCSWFYANNKFK